MPLGDRVLRFLREAEHGGLRPMFQPVVALADGAIPAHELLTHPYELGLMKWMEGG